MTAWSPTPVLWRSGTLSTAALLGAVLTGRPALVVLAVPFLVHVAAGLWHRPATEPEVATRLSHRTLREGEATTVLTTVSCPEAESVAVLTFSSPYAVVPRAQRATLAVADGETTTVPTGVQARRWGVHETGSGQLAVSSTWSGFRWGPRSMSTSPLTVLPQGVPFDAAAQAPRPVGLVGAHRSLRDGTGREFSGIREFAVGDRLRRIHWRSSLRTGRLQVITTNAEQDSEVVLLVDAMADLGRSAGLGGDASTLDVTVRAAGALAEHHLRLGDRVGLRVLGRTSTVVPARAGTRQHRRILEVLALVRPGRPVHLDVNRMHRGLGAGAIVLVLSPLLAEEATAAVALLARSGLTAVAVDTSPSELTGPWQADPLSAEALAWRIRMLERDVELRALRAAGIPVVRWRGPGTLDEVMLRLSRRSALPRTAVR